MDWLVAFGEGAGGGGAGEEGGEAGAEGGVVVDAVGRGDQAVGSVGARALGGVGVPGRAGGWGVLGGEVGVGDAGGVGGSCLGG